MELSLKTKFVSYTQQRWVNYALLVAIAIPFFFLNIVDTHSWGDDFAQYIKESQNIATGQAYYLSGYIFNPYNTVYAPPYYPPGFPLLLAPVVMVWGCSFSALCYFNSCIAALLLFALFRFFRSYASATASLCMTTLICYSATLIDLKSNVLADVPCLLFVTLYLTARRKPGISWAQIAWLVFLASFAIQIRTQALLLPAAEAIYLVSQLAVSVIKRRRADVSWLIRQPSLYVVTATLSVSILLSETIFRAPSGTIDFYDRALAPAWNNGLLEWVNGHIANVYKVLTSFFYYPGSNPLLQTLVGFVESAAITFSVTGFFIKVRRSFEMHDVCFLLVCVTVLFYPFFDTRYFLPAAPMLFVYCYYSLRTFLPGIVPANPRVVATCGTVVYLWLVGSPFLLNAATTTHAHDIPSSRDLTAFNYIAGRVSDNDIIVFSKPRALSLFTGKRSMNLSLQIPPSKNRKVFDSMQVKYVLVADGIEDKHLRFYVHHIQQPIDSTAIAEGYMLYTLR